MSTSFAGRLRPKKSELTNWTDLTSLPNQGQAFIYQRLSSYEQMRRSVYSIKAQDALEDLAKEDGYKKEQIHVETSDLGISGTKGREDRPGLAYLIEQVEAERVEAVYVVHISRLYRDQTLINAFSLGELFKQHNVMIVTPYMRLNLRDKMHMRLFRMEVERAADELEVMAQRMQAPRNMKAKAGYYSGESIPPGYVTDERKELENGQANPDYHTYEIFEPYAEIVRLIFKRFALPGMTPTRIARYLEDKGIAFPPYPPELNTKAHLKTFTRAKRNQDGNWIITVHRIRSIATNPAYIGWKIWQGEVISKNVFDPIIDEATFWTVQKRFRKNSRPKSSYDPLPLAGLLYCSNHEILREMTYSSGINRPKPLYTCYEDYITREACMYLSHYILDDPIGEAVISQLALPGLAKQIIAKLTDEFEQAKVEAASYRREAKRLETEIENLRSNLAMETLSADQIGWIDQQIQDRLSRITELSNLEKQPLGAISKSASGQADIELVESFLDSLHETWDSQPKGLKNALLRLILEKVIIYNDHETIRATIVWRVGLEQEILIHKPFPRDHFTKRWTESERELLRQHYATASIDELLKMFPKRGGWSAIKCQAQKLKLRRKRQQKGSLRRFTPEQDEIVRRFFNGELNIEQAEELAGRNIESMRARGRHLGLRKCQPKVSWEWVNNGIASDTEDPPRPQYRLKFGDRSGWWGWPR